MTSALDTDGESGGVENVAVSIDSSTDDSLEELSITSPAIVVLALWYNVLENQCVKEFLKASRK